MKIKALFFDLDDTLHDSQYPFEKTVKELLPEVASELNMNELSIKFREASDFFWKDYVAGNMSLVDLRTKRIMLALKRMGSTIDYETARLFQNHYEYNQSQLKMFPEVPSLLEELNKKGITVGMITNGPVEHQHSKITSLGLKSQIPNKLIFVSDGVGLAKPNPEIFHHVRKHVNLLPHELLYIGDSWENDIVGSSKAGWQSLWFNHRKKEPETNHKPLAVIHNLSSILDYV